jgi:hypothetical protein
MIEAETSDGKCVLLILWTVKAIALNDINMKGVCLGVNAAAQNHHRYR